MTPSKELKERYRASMLLSAAGDALGYKNQEWEYCKSGPQIHRELDALGGLSNIAVSLPGWPVSDDTVMHLATAEALVEEPEVGVPLYRRLAEKYIESMDDMEGRKPGPTSIQGCKDLKPNEEGGFRVPFNPKASGSSRSKEVGFPGVGKLGFDFVPFCLFAGCGAAMRAMCVGLRFPSNEELPSLVAVGVESGRMTHHHPTGYLGAVAAAFFTACAISQIPLPLWGRQLVKNVLPLAKSYVAECGVAVQENIKGFNYFETQWRKYLNERGIAVAEKNTQPVFPDGFELTSRLPSSFASQGQPGDKKDCFTSNLRGI